MLCKLLAWGRGRWTCQSGQSSGPFLTLPCSFPALSSLSWLFPWPFLALADVVSQACSPTIPLIPSHNLRSRGGGGTGLCPPNLPLACPQSVLRNIEKGENHLPFALSFRPILSLVFSSLLSLPFSLLSSSPSSSDTHSFLRHPSLSFSFVESIRIL